MKRRSFATLALSLLLISCSQHLGFPLAPSVFGQLIEGPGNADDPNNNDGGTDEPTTDNPNEPNNNTVVIGNLPAGIHINAVGVLRVRSEFGDPLLARKRLAAALIRRGEDVFRVSARRQISLTRLAQAVLERASQGLPLTEEMRHLAGLTRVRYVFLFPESGEVILAGPAEGWFEDGNGNVLTIESNQPVIRLEDLAVALRTFPAGKSQETIVGCSIDPTREGLRRMQEYLHRIGPQPPRPRTIADGLKRTLGQHLITVQGVPAATRFAQIMIAADYRMKLIGIGLEQPPANIPSYVALARPNAKSNAMARWYFTPNYHCVRMDEGELSIELLGDGVRLISESEFVSRDGSRNKAVRRDGASERFVAGFTKEYANLASRSPVFAELRNLIDLCIAAAFLQEFDAYGRCHWSPTFLIDDTHFSVKTKGIPKSVGTAATAIWKGSRLMTPVGGGVSIQAREALRDENRVPDDRRELYVLRSSLQIEEDRGTRWWWD